MRKEISVLIPFFMNDEFTKFISCFENKLEITKEEECIIIYWKYKLNLKGKKEHIDNFIKQIKNYSLK